MKIALIKCPLKEVKNREIEPPVGLGYLTAFLKNKGHEVFLFDLAKEFFDGSMKSKLPSWSYREHYWTYKFLMIKPLLENFYRRKLNDILNTDAKLIGISVSSEFSIKSSLLLAKMIKKMDKNRIIVLGGTICLDYGKKFLDSNYIDAVVIGEGELTLNEIVDSVEKKKKITLCPGVMINKNGKTFCGGNRLLINNLDAIPHPDYSNIVDTSEIRYPIAGSRGCIFNCAFCSANFFWQRFRFRSAESIFQEIKYVNKKYGINSFIFVDSLVNGNIKELSELCDKITKNKLPIKWIGNCVIRKEMNKKLFKKMHKAGCQKLFFGVESGSQCVLNSMNKNFELSIVEKVLKNAHDAGINVTACFIIGFPTETITDFFQTLLLLIKNRKNIDDISLNLCSILPGSELYKNHKKYGINKSIDTFRWKTRSNKNTYLIRKIRFAFSLILTLFLRKKS